MKWREKGICFRLLSGSGKSRPKTFPCFSSNCSISKVIGRSSLFHFIADLLYDPRIGLTIQKRPAALENRIFFVICGFRLAIDDADRNAVSELQCLFKCSKLLGRVICAVELIDTFAVVCKGVDLVEAYTRLKNINECITFIFDRLLS